MNKKQRNRKQVKQNKRNRIINRRYTSTIKTLFKLFLVKKQNNNTNISPADNTKINSKIELQKLVSNIYSIVDKATKKKVIHRNTAARKKSKIAFLLTSI